MGISWLKKLIPDGQINIIHDTYTPKIDAYNNGRFSSHLPYLLVLGIIALICSFILSVIYIIMIIYAIANNKRSENDVNINTLEYQSVQSLSMRNTTTSFNYTYVLILPLIALVCVLLFFALWLIWAPITQAIYPSNIKNMLRLAYIVFGAAVFVVGSQALVYFKVGKNIGYVSDRLNKFDLYVCSHIYTRSAFLKVIKEPATNIIGVNNAVHKCLKIMYTRDTSVDELAKAFYTLTIYYHFQKLSLRNYMIYDAFKTFGIFNLPYLLKRECKPSAYLSRYGTYIEDISDILIRSNLDKNIRNLNVDEAFLKCSEWILVTSELANGIYPEDAFNAFIIIAIISVIIQITPIFIYQRFALSSG